MKEKNNNNLFNNPTYICNLILILIVFGIILSQSFVIKNTLNVINILNFILNYNGIYLIMFIYFISLKFNFGKIYYNYFNLFLILIYFISCITSFLNAIQILTLGSVINFFIKFVLFIYMFHSFLRDTRIWKELNLESSLFNEFSNDSYFYCINILSLIGLVNNLIIFNVIDDIVLSIIKFIFILLFSRYIYLYSDYICKKNGGRIE